MLLRHVTVVALILAIVGCGKQELLEKFTTPEERAAAEGYIELLRQHEYEAIERSMDPSLTGPSIRQTLAAMSAAMPASKPTSVKFGWSAEGEIGRLHNNQPKLRIPISDEMVGDKCRT